MLNTTKDMIQDLNAKADVRVFGQELNPETYAVSKSDFFLKTEDGKDAENIKQGSALSDPQHRGETFNYMLANPPYGKNWNRDKKYFEDKAKEHERDMVDEHFEFYKKFIDDKGFRQDQIHMLFTDVQNYGAGGAYSGDTDPPIR